MGARRTRARCVCARALDACVRRQLDRIAYIAFDFLNILPRARDRVPTVDLQSVAGWLVAVSQARRSIARARECNQLQLAVTGHDGQ